MTRILVVEDDAAILRGLVDNLRYEGYEVDSAMTAEDGLERISDVQPDLIILDVMLPGMNGFEMCRRLRKAGSDLPIMMLTAKGSEFDRVMGLDLGADDYVVKPFSILELLARVRALLRRAGDDELPASLTLGDLRVDFKRYVATRADRHLRMTRKEFGLLQYLAGRSGEAVTRDEILNHVWGDDSFPTTRTVDNHVAMLRAKIEDDPANPVRLLTVHGIGYRLDVEETSP